MNSYSIDEIMSHHPCAAYPRERVEALWGGRERMTLAEILDLPIPAADRVWVIRLNPPDGWADRVADRAVRTHAMGCGIIEVEDWAARWLSGDDRSLRSVGEAIGEARRAEDARNANAAAAAWAVAAAAWASGWGGEDDFLRAADHATNAAARAAGMAADEYGQQVQDARDLLAQEAPCDC